MFALPPCWLPAAPVLSENAEGHGGDCKNTFDLLAARASSSHTDRVMSAFQF